MGANKNSNLQKCGEMLLHIKNINKKTKMYTFRCSFCGTDCDQLKKFSMHLEEQHINQFAEELEEAKIIEPEIKLEENVEIEETGCFKKYLRSTQLNDNNDPLETVLPAATISNLDDLENVKVKEETSHEKLEDDNFIDEMNCESSRDNSEIDEEYSKDKKTTIKGNNKKITKIKILKKSYKSDDSSNDSKEVDFEIEKELNTSQKYKRSKKKFKTIDESQLPVLIKLYKKYELLWQVNNIAFGITAKRDEELQKMVGDLKLNHKLEITIEDIQDHINYINHAYSKDKELQLNCEAEKREFKPSSRFYEEMSFLKESQGPFKCSVCNVIIAKFEHYHIHVAKHNDTLAFNCTLCEMGFNTFNKYLVHVKRHLGVYSYHCNVCGKGYPFKAELDWHLTSHTGDKPYLCQICGAGFRARHGYDNHIRRHEKRFRYECHICKHGFNHLHRLNSHVKSHLNIRDIICNVCGKGFTARKYLQRHKLIHDDEKRYKCKVCGKAFAQDSGLRAHRKQHQPYSTLAENKNSLVQSYI